MGCFLLLMPLIMQAQQLSNFKTKIIIADYPAQKIDSLSIIPHTVKVLDLRNNTLLDTTFYTIKNNKLLWKKELANTDSLQLTYRSFPYQFAEKQQHLDTLKIAKDIDPSQYIQFDYSPYAQQDNSILDRNALDYSGSFSRGIAFGNRQDLVLNSSFNLQMAGTIGDDIEIRAAMSDNNIPLQAEGNTQQLQDFDKIYIQILKNKHQLTVGDYEIYNKEANYFSKYYKKLQGATYQNATTIFSKGTLTSQASVAIARGKFARNTLVNREGNQGPYRLQGNQQERFIILLAGTEKVYWDGQLLQRGIENDYIMDYNQGSISFTTQRLVTKDSRIIVEFEYADQNYLRSLYALESTYQDEKLQLSFQLFSQQDSKNTSGLNELSAESKQALANSGDDFENSIASGIRAIDENSSPITYTLIDSLVDGIVYDSILLYTVHPDSAQYTARFTEVGFGNGYYIRLNDATNGTVFQWLAPAEDGSLQGNYAPVIQLSAPIKQQIYSINAQYQLSKKSNIRTEIAVSNYDFNRFSDLDARDNIGTAVFSHYHFESPFGKKDSTWIFTSDAKYEYKQNHFTPLNPYRNAEFTRDWNLDTLGNFDEHIGVAAFSIAKKALGQLNYEARLFLRNNNYKGIKHYGQFRGLIKGFEWQIIGNFLSTESTTEQSQFFRPKIDFSKTFKQLKNFQIGVYAEREHNERRSETDTLIASSFYYDFYKIYIKNKEDSPLFWNLDYGQRIDYAPTMKVFQQASIADEWRFHGKWKTNKSSFLRWNLTYRNLKIQNQSLTEALPLETYLGRLEYGSAFFKGAVRSSTAYELGSGQEPQIAYNYLEVNTGEGIYQWNDYNRDSIQQVNEFEIAITQDQARFIRVSILTNDFIRTNKVQFNQSFMLNPIAIWHQEKKGLKHFLSKWASQSTFSINRRTRLSEEVQIANPFQLNLQDSTLVANTLNIRNTLFFNRSHPIYDLQIGAFNTQNRIVLNTGFEDRRSTEQFFKVRWQIIKKLTTTFYIAQGRQQTDSEFFNQRDYHIRFQKWTPTLAYTHNTIFTIKGSYESQKSKNILKTNGEEALIHKFQLYTTFNQSAKTAIKLDISYVKVSYTGMSNTPIAFAMLENLQDGENFLWNLNFDRQLGRNIQLSIGYEGRKTGILPVVHIGRAAVRALF